MNVVYLETMRSHKKARKRSGMTMLEQDRRAWEFWSEDPLVSSAAPRYKHKCCHFSLQDSGKYFIKVPRLLPAITLPNAVFNRTGFSCRLTSVLIIFCMQEVLLGETCQAGTVAHFFPILSKNNFSSLMEHKNGVYISVTNSD